MKINKTAALLTVILTLFLALGYHSGFAAAQKQIAPLKCGVVNVRTVLEKNKQNLEWEKKMNAEGQEITAQLKKLSDEVDAAEAVMKTRKPGTEEYAKQLKEYTEKKALLQARDEFYQKDFSSRQQKWAETMYQKALEVIKKVAQQKGLDMVMAAEDFQFPTASANELMLTIKTGKVLYHSPGIDITEEVLAAFDAD